MNRTRLMVAACIIVICGGLVFGAGQTGEAAATEKLMEITWLGLGLKAGGGMLFPDPEESEIVLGLNEALNIKLIPIQVAWNDPRQVNLLFASGDIPDHWFNFSKELGHQRQNNTFFGDSYLLVTPRVFKIKAFEHSEHIHIACPVIMIFYNVDYLGFIFFKKDYS